MEDVGLVSMVAMDKARKFRETDLRARALVDSAVAHSLRNRGKPEEECDFEEYAYDIATVASTMLMQHIYENDAELFAIRAERDHYKTLAERMLVTMPPRPFVIDNAG